MQLQQSNKRELEAVSACANAIAGLKKLHTMLSREAVAQSITFADCLEVSPMAGVHNLAKAAGMLAELEAVSNLIIQRQLLRIYTFFNAPHPACGLPEIAARLIARYPMLAQVDFANFANCVIAGRVYIHPDPYNPNAGTRTDDSPTGWVKLHGGTVYGNLSEAQLTDWLNTYCEARESERDAMIQGRRAQKDISIAQKAAVLTEARGMVVGADGVPREVGLTEALAGTMPMGAADMAFADDWQAQVRDLLKIGGIQALRTAYRVAKAQGRHDVMGYCSALAGKNGYGKQNDNQQDKQDV